MEVAKFEDECRIALGTVAWLLFCRLGLIVLRVGTASFELFTGSQCPSPVAGTALYSHTALPGWDGKWNSAQSFCQAQGGDLCDYADLCPGGRTTDSVFGQLAQDEWIPVKGTSILKDYVQIGTRVSPRDDCCLISDSVCHGLGTRSDWADAWGSRQPYQDHFACCFD